MIEVIRVCPKCGHKNNMQESSRVSCTQVMGQYGGIVLADAWCENCGIKIVNGEIFDNSGNIPPRT